MADSFVLLPCKGCSIATTLPLRSLPDITQSRRQSSTDTDFANFVCPRCGLGSVHLVVQLERREAVSVARVVRPPLYRAFLKCGAERCKLRVVAHTTARSGVQKAEPTKAVREWKVDALACADGHRAKHPTEQLDHDVFEPEPE